MNLVALIVLCLVAIAVVSSVSKPSIAGRLVGASTDRKTFVAYDEEDGAFGTISGYDRFGRLLWREDGWAYRWSRSWSKTRRLFVGDGRSCVVASDWNAFEANTVQELDLATRARRTLLTCASSIRCIGVSPDDGWIVVLSHVPNVIASVAGKIEIVSRTNGNIVASISGPDFGPGAIAVSSDGQLIAAYGPDAGPQVFRWRTGEIVTLPLESRRDYPEDCDISFSSDGRYLAASDARMVRVWDLNRRRIVSRILVDDVRIFRVRLSGDNRCVVVGLVEPPETERTGTSTVKQAAIAIYRVDSANEIDRRPTDGTFELADQGAVLIYADDGKIQIVDLD